MYTGELNGMTLTLPDEDYKILKKRLMVSKAVDEGWQYTIREGCICERYDPHCDICPFDDSCSTWIDAFDTEGITRFGYMRLSWVPENDKEARTIIKSMRKALLGMKHEEV